jgi:hypothetical protein
MCSLVAYLAFEPEIARLRSEGYSCEAIWEALLEAGVSLSRSSVKREVARLAKRGVAHPSAATAAAYGQPSQLKPRDPLPATPPSLLQSKEMAAAWMKDRITNPLIRARIAHESSRR